MKDIGGKKVVGRMASAEGKILLGRGLKFLREGTVGKGDPFETARIAGISAVKRTSYMIPLCHNIPIEFADVGFIVDDEGVTVRCIVKSHGKTGVEMEALSGAVVALLTLWDMVKEYEKDEKGNYPNTMITEIRVVKKVKEDG